MYRDNERASFFHLHLLRRGVEHGLTKTEGKCLFEPEPTVLDNNALARIVVSVALHEVQCTHSAVFPSYTESELCNANTLSFACQHRASIVTHALGIQNVLRIAALETETTHMHNVSVD